jgi:hypothetical protein
MQAVCKLVEIFTAGKLEIDKGSSERESIYNTADRTSVYLHTSEYYRKREYDGCTETQRRFPVASDAVTTKVIKGLIELMPTPSIGGDMQDISADLEAQKQIP